MSVGSRSEPNKAVKVDAPAHARASCNRPRSCRTANVESLTLGIRAETQERRGSFRDLVRRTRSTARKSTNDST